ncbi:MAG: DUF2189 domain-containing protein [Gammaproteobacteria bacterium]|nr:DUF2189 domain-containing protein [Gammaproteobacteria bacterium]
MSAESQVDDIPDPQFHVCRVEMTRPLAWIRSGWEDLNHHRGASVAHGLLVTGLGFIILLFATTHIYFMAAAISGFLLVGPVMATGLCELSRRRARGESEGFDESLDALDRNRTALWQFASALVGFSLLWFIGSALILQLSLGQAAPRLSETVWGDLLAALTPLQIPFYLGIGGVLACLVFVLSVVSVPAIIDRSITASTAMRMSMHAFAANWQAMLVWGALIVSLTAIGFLTFLLGLIIIYPLLGHGTWYAYRDLIE